MIIRIKGLILLLVLLCGSCKDATPETGRPYTYDFLTIGMTVGELQRSWYSIPVAIKAHSIHNRVERLREIKHPWYQYEYTIRALEPNSPINKCRVSTVRLRIESLENSRRLAEIQDVREYPHYSVDEVRQYMGVLARELQVENDWGEPASVSEDEIVYERGNHCVRLQFLENTTENKALPVVGVKVDLPVPSRIEVTIWRLMRYD